MPKNKKLNRAENKEFKLSLKPQKHDARDLLLSVEKLEYPVKAGITKLPPIRNQGNIGSCASHAVIGCYETLLLNFKPNRFIEGSELYHYYNARKFISKSFPKDTGMTLRDACKTLDKYHMALEYACPYITSKYNEEPPKSAYLTSGLYKIKSYESLLSTEEIKHSIHNKIPVIVGINVHENFMRLKKGENYTPKGKFVGGHAVVIVGYNDEDDTFTIRNSWGPNWGDNGYFTIKQDVFISISSDYGYWRVLI